MAKQTHLNSITFSVDGVEKSTKIIPNLPYAEVVKKNFVDTPNRREREKYARKRILQDETLQPAEKRGLLRSRQYAAYLKEWKGRTLEACSYRDVPLIDARFHPFMSALHHAYNKHYPNSSINRINFSAYALSVAYPARCKPIAHS